MRYLLISVLLITGNLGFAQQMEYIQLDDSRSKTSFYMAMKPLQEAKGMLVLLPGFGQIPQMVFPETKIPNIAYMNSLLTVIVAGGDKIYADETVTNHLNRTLEDAIKRYNIAPEKVIIGGFSAGGTIALRYVEKCLEKPDAYPTQPAAVFTIDSPIDLFELWKYMERELDRNFSEAGTAEAKFVMNIMQQELGGSPYTHAETYALLSPFQVAEKNGHEKWLKDIPVRLYHDVDLIWLLKNRRRSAYDMNAAPASELISRLLQMGNEQAELMIAEQAGVRSNGQRHPHSWSIVNEPDFIQWAKQILFED